MLLISLETAVPSSPSKSPSVAVELAVDGRLLPWITYLDAAQHGQRQHAAKKLAICKR